MPVLLTVAGVWNACLPEVEGVECLFCCTVGGRLDAWLLRAECLNAGAWFRGEARGNGLASD